jgi:hypothetical protein
LKVEFSFFAVVLSKEFWQLELGGVIKLTTDFHLAPRLKPGAITPLPNMLSW